MPNITSTTGLISGINTKDIIDQLIALDGQQAKLYQTRIDTISAQKTAYTSLVSQLTTIQTSGFALSRPTTFNGTVAKSSNSDVLSATTSAGAPVGTYQFQVARLVTSQQTISGGFTSADSLVGAGNITLELGGGQAASHTLLSQLNGGAGVNRGQFRLTDRSGHSTVIDSSNAITLDDVVKKINTSIDVSIHASISNNHLVLTDTTGSTVQQINVTDLGEGTSAKDLGILGAGVGTTLVGTNINTLGASSILNSLNDGRGVRTASSGPDFNIRTADGSTFDITLGSAATLGEVVNTINTTTGTKLTASIDPTTNGLKLVDNSSGGGTLTITPVAGIGAAADLGLLATPSGGVLQGKTLLASLDSVLISSLKGGQGLTLGKIDITNRTGTSAAVDLTGLTSLQDVLDKINTTAGLNVKATLNASGNGIAIADVSGGSGNLTIADDADATTTATLLGLNQTVDTTKTGLTGANLQRQWVSEKSSLSTYNGGKAVATGSFSITNAAGAIKTINISSSFTTLGDVIKAINNAGVGVTASVNTNGDGLLLTDTSGGAGTLTVANVSGTAASDLQIAGTATGTTIDGTFEKTIVVTAADTLTSVQNKITTLGFGVKASVINDGSASAPNHLSLTAVNSGIAGQVLIDAGTTNLNTQTLVNAQDSAVFVGGDAAAQPLLVTSSSNTVTNVIPGVTLTLNSASSSPVTLSITRDADSIVKQVQGFADGFNAVITQIATLSKWDSNANQGGLLLGDFTTQQIQQNLYQALQTVVTTAGQFHTLADVGLTLDDNANVTFDTAKFNSAYAKDPDAVKSLFTQANTGVGAAISKNLAALIDPVDGKITLETHSLDTKTQQFQTRIDDLNTLLAQKRLRLETQFANMESVLSKLQSQQTSISSLTTSTTTGK